MRVKTKWPKLVEDLFDEVLVDRGFKRLPLATAEGRRFLAWERDAGWKFDVVDLADMKWAEYSAGAEVSVSLPDWHDGYRIGVDGWTTLWLARRQPGWYRAGDPSIITEVHADLLASVKWFDERYGTPEQMLEMLQPSVERSGCNVGTEPHLRIQKMLEDRVRKGK